MEVATARHPLSLGANLARRCAAHVGSSLPLFLARWPDEQASIQLHIGDSVDDARTLTLLYLRSLEKCASGTVLPSWLCLWTMSAPQSDRTRGFDHGRNQKASEGVLALEVLVAAALGAVITTILSAEAGLFAGGRAAANMSQATAIARCRMTEIEREAAPARLSRD